MNIGKKATKMSKSAVKASKISLVSTKKKTKTVRRRGIYLFRALVRMVISNLYWLSDMTDKPLGTNADHNAYILTHKRRDKQLISLNDKLILRKPFNERSESELKSICNKLVTIKGLKMYPEAVKIELLRCSMFVHYKRNTVIVRQGRKAEFVYYILSGFVRVETETPDAFFPGEVAKTTDFYHEGETFGAPSVLYDKPHSSTISIGKCDGLELLVLDESDFKRILGPSVQKKWKQVRWAMKKFTYFDNFEESDLRHVSSVGEISMRSSDKVISGENLSNHHIVSITDLMLLVVPKYVLMRYNVSNVWTHCVFHMDEMYPSEEQLFRHFVQGRNWEHFKRKIMANALPRKTGFYRPKSPCSQMSIHDMPLMERAKRILLPEALCKKIIQQPDYLLGEMSDDIFIKMINSSREKTRVLFSRKSGIWNKGNSFARR